MSLPLATVAPDGDPVAFFQDRGHEGFDCAPVRSGEHILGMVYQAELRPGHRAHGLKTARDAMRPLDKVPLVAATESIASLIRSMRKINEHFWLVLDGTRINAIVTRSDLWRLPVRLLAIARIIHFEQLLTELIRNSVPGDLWISDLPPDRQKKIQAMLAANKGSNEYLEALENTNFSDKIEILRRTLKRADEAGDLGGINELRNQLMHARDGNDAEGGIGKFLERLGRLDSYIVRYTDELSKMVNH